MAKGKPVKKMPMKKGTKPMAAKAMKGSKGALMKRLEGKEM